MKRIYTLGETVYDIIFSSGKIESSCVGGSVVNTSVSLGRLKNPVHLISQYGRDKIGETIETFLNKNNINTDYIYRYSDVKTPLALAFLNEFRDAKYEFYKEKPHKHLDVSIPDFQENDILLFGSYFSINLDLRDNVLEIVKSAKDKKCLIIYDPNFRNPHKAELEKLKQNIMENIEFSDIIRGSKDDFVNIFGLDSPNEIFNLINKENKILIFTDGGKKTYFRSSFLKFDIEVPEVEVISTIGAGDNFNAGLIHFLLGLDKSEILKLLDLSALNIDSFNEIEDKWQNAISNGISFAQEVCKSYHNYISLDFASSLMKGEN
jgi:fructokinase